MAMVERDGHIVRYVNPAFCRLMDKSAVQLVGSPFSEMLLGKCECTMLLDRVFHTGKPESYTGQEHSELHPICWFFTMWPVFEGEHLAAVMIQVLQTTEFHEKVVAMNEALMLGSLHQHEQTEEAEHLNKRLREEIADRMLAEDRQQLLANELAHRGKNLLAVIQAIVSRSLSGTRSLAEARDVLMRRVQALARSQSVLLLEGFEGVPLSEITRLELEAFSGRVEIAGPAVILNPKVAQTFALVMHELATNATKHGALSLPVGRVAIRWSIEGAGAAARFTFHWQEYNGPLVVPPTHRGFGRILIEDAMAQDFGTSPKISFAPEGLIYEIDASLSAVVAERLGVIEAPAENEKIEPS
jgi:two-component sensor histidine kinase